MNVNGFRSYGYIYDDSSSNVIDFLQKKGSASRKNQEFYNGRSVVGIEEQYKLTLGDLDQEFAQEYFSMFQSYEDEFGYVYNNFPNFMGDLTPPMTFFNNMRICYQKKGEFYSPTRNEGSHTFISFLKVPFDYEEEVNHTSNSRKLENFEMTSTPSSTQLSVGPAFNQDSPGSLNFLYPLQSGSGLGSESITIDSYTEGRSFLFPSSQIFYINPFYVSDEPLVYVIGSLCFSTKASTDEYKDEEEEKEELPSVKEGDGSWESELISGNPDDDGQDNYFDS